MISLEEFELTPIREFSSYQESHYKLSRYLLGYDCPSVGRLADPYVERLPLLDSSLAAHIREVNRFLFNGGLQLDIEGARPDDPRQLVIKRVAKANSLNRRLEQLWWEGAIYGELAIAFRRGEGVNLYPFDFYAPDEYKPFFDSEGSLIALAICLVREVDGKRHVYRQWLDSERVVSYPLVEERLSKSYDWAANRQETFHGWGLTPAVLIRNQQSLSCFRGKPEFNQGCLDKASELALAYLDSASNHHSFANPIYVSPDPEATLKALKARVQVLQSESADDGGNTHILAPQGMPTSHFELIDRLKASLVDALGRSHAEQATPDSSSLTLRLLNAKTISLAENRWVTYVEEGLIPLMQKVLLAAAIDGVIAGVSAANMAEIQARRSKPYFPTAPSEKTQLLTVASELTSLGVRREVALREVFPELTDEQILEILEGY